MRFNEWLQSFRQLHQQAERGDLDPAERALYDEVREEFLTAVGKMQQLSLLPGQTLRQHVRVKCSVEVEVGEGDDRGLCFTLDLSVGGMSVVLSSPPSNVQIPYSILLVGGPPISGRAMVLGTMPWPQNRYRVSMRFLNITLDEQMRLESFVTLSVLAWLTG